MGQNALGFKVIINQYNSAVWGSLLATHAQQGSAAPEPLASKWLWEIGAQNKAA